MLILKIKVFAFVIFLFKLYFVVDRIGLENEKQLEINYNQRQTSIENNKPLLSMSAYFDVIKEFLVPITGRETRE